MSQSSNTDSGGTSPETQFPLPSGSSDSTSNIDLGSNHTPNDILHRSSQMPQNADGNYQPPASESAFPQGGGHPVYNSNNFSLSDYLSESENHPLKVPPQGTKSPGDFGAGPFRSSFSAYNGTNGAHVSHSGSGNPPPSSFRMRQINPASATSQSFASVSENFTGHPLGIQHQLSQQSQQGSSVSGFESRGIDFGSNPPLTGKVPQLDPFLQSHTTKTQVHDSFHPLSHGNSVGQVPYLNGIHLQSQTPYGPHLQSSGPVGSGVSNTARGLSATGQLNVAAEPQSGSQQEEISTIFVVGFPDDMQEREFQNMFTFSSGFEAATLKIPNKEYTAYGTSGGTPSGLPLRGSSSYSSYFNSGPNDPYNIVTVNQGGVVVDNGRDGPTTSWPPLPVPVNDEPNHFQGPGGQPPRKQIIGFAKFRTRQEALEARDMLQGRRVDIEKGAVLKAEMAKKNLHTKRGVGIGNSSSSGGSVSLGNTLNAFTGLNGGVGGLHALGGLGVVTPDTFAGLTTGINLNPNMNVNPLASLGGGDPLAARERELNALSAMGYNNLSGGWREGRLGECSEEERERDRDRDRERRREALVGLNLGLGIGGRGARERAIADEEERERLRRKDFKVFQGEAIRLLSGNSAVYDAFHPTSPLSRNVQTSVLSSHSSDGASSGPNSILGNGFGIIAQTSARDDSGSREVAGPWDQPSARERDFAYSTLSSFYGTRKVSVIPRPPSPQDTSPPKPSIPFSPSLNDEDNMLPPHRSGALRSTQAFTSTDEPVVIRPPAPPSSSTSSTSGLDDGGPIPLTVSTSGQASAGNTSPQLPSPASHAGSAASSSLGGHAASSSSSGVPNTVGGVGPRNALVDQNPPINTLYVGNLPTSPVSAGYPANYLEDSLRDLFSRRPGYRKLCFRQKSNGPMCFVEFEDVHYATKALNELYGNSLGGLVKNGGIRLSYSKNPLGVRTPTTAGAGTLLQQQNSVHSGVASPLPVDMFQLRPGFDGDPGTVNARRENSTTISPTTAFGGYARSPPPPRFVSPPPSGTFNMASSSPTNGTALPRGSHTFGIPLSGSGGGFSPFGLPLSPPPSQPSTLSPSHSMIPDYPSSDVPSAHGHTQHFPHRALSPSSSTVEAARAG